MNYRKSEKKGVTLRPISDNIDYGVYQDRD